MEMEDELKRVTVYNIPQWVLEAVDALAESKRMSRNSFIVTLLEEAANTNHNSTDTKGKKHNISTGDQGDFMDF